MPKDATATRSAILAAAVQTLQRGGVEGFTLETVARRAGVVKGLLLYHFGSRARMLRLAATRIAAERQSAIDEALATGRGTRGLDACWEELRRQAEDGTTRAWLSLCSAGLIDRSDSHDLEAAARHAVIDGCAAALAAGAPLPDVRDAYDALWLALLDVLEKP